MFELKINDWNDMVDINIKGLLNGMYAILPEFINKNDGHFVVVSSVGGTCSVPGNVVYCGTKHFVRALIDPFHSEIIEEGHFIRTTLIYPGMVQTELLNTIAPSSKKEMVEEYYR